MTNKKKVQPDLGGVSDDDLERLALDFLKPAILYVNRQLYEAAAYNDKAENRNVTDIANVALRRYSKGAQRRAIRRESQAQLELFPEFAPPPAALRKPRSSRFPKVLMPKRKPRDEVPTGPVDTLEPFLVYEHGKGSEGDGDEKTGDEIKTGEGDDGNERDRSSIRHESDEREDGDAQK